MPDKETLTHEFARVILEVRAGILPGTPDPAYTRRWHIGSDAWSKAEEEGQTGRLLAESNGAMMGYAGLLMLQPDILNWVTTDWIWV